jgi:precorrin-6Y C5,15-methyltransferase (decarboxylating)
MLTLLNDKKTPMPGLALGRPDKDYKHENNLITHSEVRAVILSKLQLHAGVMWDIGAGSGSVGIEAAMLVPSLHVHAIEKNEKRITLIKDNCIDHGVNNLEVHHGNGVEIIKHLPKPHIIFIGGGGKDITQLLNVCCEKIKHNGRIVVSAVTLETQHRVREYFNNKTIEHISMNITRSHKIADLHIMKPENSIDIFVYHHL